MTAPVFDGKAFPYVPGPELHIATGLKLHEEVSAQVDPVTHEVLRHALWQVNEEHGETILRISGSPVCAYSHDFNPVLCDERGDVVFFGPFVQYLAGATGSAIKWTLENRSENPGIAPGDMFLTNDPWIGAPHQSDVCLLAPVFVGDELFCWVSNVMHQWDLGGSVPGGFDPGAEEVYSEQPCIPPVKLVEGGELRRDIEEHYLRCSRLPDLVALDMRAGIGGCTVAARRVLGLVDRYGATAVKSTMRKLQDDSEAAFARRLAKIPDGTWTAESCVEAKVPGDRGAYRNVMTISKSGGRLRFSNRGSAAQQGAICCAYPAWRGAVMSALNTMLMYDQMFAIEGALRLCDFEIEPGTISAANRPAAVSGSPPGILLNSIHVTAMALSRMLQSAEAPEFAGEVQASSGAIAYPINTFGGIDQRGNEVYGFFADAMGAAQPAYATHDGQDTGGYSWDLSSTMPNVEENELFYPILYLWRKELIDSGGAGKFRGGNSAELAVVPHKTEKLSWVTVTGKTAVPAPGLAGGLPASTNRFVRIVGADVATFWKDTARMPTGIDEFVGERDLVPSKSADRVTEARDVWAMSWGAGAGYGDPLDRDPEAVWKDVEEGRVSRGHAEQAYGVVLLSGGVDQQRTVERRESVRRERLESAAPWVGGEDRELDEDAVDRRINERVAVVSGRTIVDGLDVGPATRNYKEALLVREVPVTEANPYMVDPEEYIDATVRVREFIAPGSGRLVEVEVALDDAPPTWDSRPGHQVAR